jgi:acetate---CoA ligase (ADP-forming)
MQDPALGTRRAALLGGDPLPMAGHHSSLEALLQPASVAVIGASRSRASVGGEIFANLVRRPFAGAVYAVNPNARNVQGVRAYKSIAEVPELVDLAIVAVPAVEVPHVARDCAQARVRAAVVISAGFAEVGPQGAHAQEEIVGIARNAGMRLVGPNCLGVVSTDPDVCLHATFSTGWPPRGNVSVASQSGALGIALLDEARDHGIGIRHFVSLGNEADVSAEDLLEHWENDPDTRVILLYLESFRDPRRFLDVARRVISSKPIVVVKGGRSPAGARAAGSHTGALATRDVVVDALLTQAGVLRVATLQELFDAATLLTCERKPAGRRVAIITNAGGPGILAADACEARGLAVPAFGDGTARALAGALPHASLRNPVDLSASATPQSFDSALPLALGDRGIDSLLVVCVPTTSADVAEVARVIASSRTYAEKPVVACVMGKHGVDEARAVLRSAGVPTYALPESAAGALAVAANLADSACRVEGKPAPKAGLSATSVRTRIAVHTRDGGQREKGGWVDGDEVTALLEAFGIQSIPSVTEHDAEGAARAAAALGFPVALKIVSRAVRHKSDVGGVLLDLRDVAAVREGVATLERRMAAAGHKGDLDGVLVQPMAPRGVEMFLGASRDPVFGPVVAFGTGGIELELWNDVVFRIAPLTSADALAMLDSIRGRALLDGFRGAPAGDREALVDAILRVSRLVEDVPEVVELDLNPLVALEPGRGVVAVDARVRVRGPE